MSSALFSFCLRTTILLASTFSIDAGIFGDDHAAGVEGRARLDAGADERRFGAHERHRLALHVRSHERAVRVVVLEERNQSGSDGDQLHGRNVHVGDFLRRHNRKVAAVPGEHLLFGDLSLFVKRRVRLRDDVVVFLVGGQVLDDAGQRCRFPLSGTAFR